MSVPWQARELLGVRAVPAAERDIVAYLPRGSAGSAGVFNGGRRIADEDALLDGLAAALEGRPERLEARTFGSAHLRKRTVAKYSLIWKMLSRAVPWLVSRLTCDTTSPARPHRHTLTDL